MPIRKCIGKTATVHPQVAGADWTASHFAKCEIAPLGHFGLSNWSCASARLSTLPELPITHAQAGTNNAGIHRIARRTELQHPNAPMLRVNLAHKVLRSRQKQKSLGSSPKLFLPGGDRRASLIGKEPVRLPRFASPVVPIRAGQGSPAPWANCGRMKRGWLGSPPAGSGAAGALRLEPARQGRVLLLVEVPGRCSGK